MKTIFHVEDRPDGVVALPVQHIVNEADGVGVGDGALVKSSIVNDHPQCAWVLLGHHESWGCPVSLGGLNPAPLLKFQDEFMENCFTFSH